MNETESSANIYSGTIPSLDDGQPSILIHGGAWDIPDDETQAHLEGLHLALAHGESLLRNGKSALDVAVEVMVVMEAHPAFDAGYGAVLNRDGSVELDAGLMCGDTLAFGAVAGVRHIKHPIRVAHRLMLHDDGQARILVGEGAERFAEAQGFELISNESLIVPRERARFERLKLEYQAFHTSHAFLPSVKEAPQGTIGCVVRDKNGCLAAATSTGGAPYTLAGRIGDSPLPGCGFYANRTAAVSSTGWGEAIATVLLAGRTVDRIETGMLPEEAAVTGLTQMHRLVRNVDGTGATGGLIVMDAQGRGGWAYTTPRMARAGWQEGGKPWTEV